MPGEKKDQIKISQSPRADLSLPIRAEYVVVGELCVFRSNISTFMIRRVLQFVVFDKNRKKQPYRGNYVNIKDTCSYGVMCTWYKKSDLCCVFKLTISEP